ncbi:MAG TPA: M50 family metallopeptidase, partial [Anaerolineales bacterium]|nr:M50 family metallopeptidase [Anaerolineales bacterium]
MNETILTWLVFILAFGGMVLIHEFGHFIVARWSGVEVEEFGVGLPTPGALTLWTSKGFLLLKSGKRIEIPFNFRLPVQWNQLIENEVIITVDQIRDRLVMRSIEATIVEEQGRNGNALEAQVDPGQLNSRKLVQAGKTTGEIQLNDVVAEVHPGTRFTFNWLPFGGFVRPKGENDPSVPGGLAAASPWKRLAVLFAGPLMNLLAAVLIYSIIINVSGGILTLQSDGNAPTQVLVSHVTENLPAAQAGFQDGDVFVSGAGKSIQTYEDLNAIVNSHLDKPVTFVVERNGNQIELTVTPRMNEQEKRPMIGVSLCTGCIFKPVTTPGENIRYSLQYTFNQMYGLVTLPVQMI